MKSSRIVMLFLLLASSVTLAQEGKFVFINGKYVPYRASGRYEINGETIFYKNERTYDRVPETAKKEQLDPYGRPVVSDANSASGKPAGPNAETKKMVEAYTNRLKSGAGLKGGTPQPPLPPAVPIGSPTSGPTVNVIQAPPPEPKGEKSLAEPARSY